MFPVSGAEQLKISGANGSARPMISQSGAYSVLVSPAPYSLAGRNRFQSPAARAFALSSSTSGIGCQRSPCVDLFAEALLVRIDVRVHEGGQPRLQILHFR